MTGAAGGRVLIVSDVADRELVRVRNALSHASYQLADGRDSIRSLLDLLAKNPEPAPAGRWLDLVGHSVEHCFLQMGSWTLDETAPDYFQATLKRQLQALQITKVRLLGCSTATTDRSWKVITDLADGLGGGTEVFGTRRLIDEADYNAHGFVSVDALAGSRAALLTDIHHPPILDHDHRIWAGNGPPTLQAALRTTKHTCYAACAVRRLTTAAG